MAYTKVILIMLFASPHLGCADELAYGDVDENGKLNNRGLTDISWSTARGYASFFLDDPMESRDYTHVSTVRSSFLAEMKGSASSSKVASLEEALRPIFTALPKNGEGRLNNGTARYALHRHFTEKHGWAIKGLQPAGGSWMIDMSMDDDVKDISKYMVPTHLQHLILSELGVSSFDLHSLAILAATLEHLIHAEMINVVYSVYTALRLPIPGKRNKQQVDDILDTFMMVYSFGLNLDVSDYDDVKNAKLHLDRYHAGWPKLRAFAQDIKRSIFATGELDFDEIMQVVERIGEKYVDWQGRDCSRLKDELAGKPSYSNGAVKLSETSQFSANGGREMLYESKAYLQKLGALLENNTNATHLVVANYINSQSMCLSTASFYAACCVNECEGLLAKLEREFRAPAAKPEALAEYVKGLPGVNMQETAELTTLVDPSTGLVALHSRAFATWMHSAFPLKCSAPDVTHIQKVTNPKTADEWIDDSGLEFPELEEMMIETASVLAKFTTMGKSSGNWVDEEHYPNAVDSWVVDADGSSQLNNFTTMGKNNGSWGNPDRDIIRSRPEEQEASLPMRSSDSLPVVCYSLALVSLLAVGILTASQSLSANRDPTSAKKRIQEVDHTDFA